MRCGVPGLRCCWHAAGAGDGRHLFFHRGAGGKPQGRKDKEAVKGGLTIMPLVTGMYMHNVIIKQEGFFTRGKWLFLKRAGFIYP